MIAVPFAFLQIAKAIRAKELMAAANRNDAGRPKALGVVREGVQQSSKAGACPSLPEQSASSMHAEVAAYIFLRGGVVCDEFVVGLIVDEVCHARGQPAIFALRNSKAVLQAEVRILGDHPLVQPPTETC